MALCTDEGAGRCASRACGAGRLTMSSCGASKRRTADSTCRARPMPPPQRERGGHGARKAARSTGGGVARNHHAITITMQSQSPCDHHAISVHSTRSTGGGVARVRVSRAWRWRLDLRAERLEQSPCNHHAIRMPSTCNQRAISVHSTVQSAIQSGLPSHLGEQRMQSAYATTPRRAAYAICNQPCNHTSASSAGERARAR